MIIKNLSIFAALSVAIVLVLTCLLAVQFHAQAEPANADIVAKDVVPYMIGIAVFGTLFWLSVFAIIGVSLRNYLRNKALKLNA